MHDFKADIFLIRKYLIAASLVCLIYLCVHAGCAPTLLYSVKELTETKSSGGTIQTFVIEKNGKTITETGFVYAPTTRASNDVPAVFLVHGGGTSSDTFKALSSDHFLDNYFQAKNSGSFLFVVLPSHTDPKIFEKILVKTIWPYLNQKYGMDLNHRRLAIGGSSGGCVLAAMIAAKYDNYIAMFYLTVAAFNVTDFNFWVEASNPTLKNFPEFYQMAGIDDPMYDKQMELGQYLQAKGIKSTTQSMLGGHDMNVVRAGMLEFFSRFQSFLERN